MWPHPINLGHAGLSYMPSHPVVQAESGRRAHGFSMAVTMVVDDGERSLGRPDQVKS